MTLGLIGVIYGALLAFAQEDLKRLVAYSSVSHMGLIVVGIFCLNLAGLKGGIVQMLNHGLSTGALFILVGALYERKKTRNLNRLGGLAGRTPVLATFFVITMLSSVGLPGLNGFVGEFLLLMGSFQFAWWLGVLAATSVVLGAVYLLWMTQRVLFEKDRSPENRLWGLLAAGKDRHDAHGAPHVSHRPLPGRPDGPPGAGGPRDHRRLGAGPRTRGSGGNGCENPDGGSDPWPSAFRTLTS
jgi:NADH:ubiquinone oxidoreductase subunit 4 (subunit M)